MNIMKVLIHRMSSNYRILKSRCKLENVDNRNVIRGIAKQRSSLQKFTYNEDSGYWFFLSSTQKKEYKVDVFNFSCSNIQFFISSCWKIVQFLSTSLRSLRFERDKKKQSLIRSRFIAHVKIIFFYPHHPHHFYILYIQKGRRNEDY